MKKKYDKTISKRVQEFRLRERNNGLVRVEVKVPAAKKQDVRDYAKSLCDRDTNLNP
jgi:hypothetical protein